MKFEIGNVVSGTGDSKVCYRKVINIIKNKYEFQFVYGGQTTYMWSFTDAEMIFELVAPNHIPKEQYDLYRKLKNG